MTLGFLGGGMMASALIKGLIKAEVLPNFAICVSDPYKPTRDRLAADTGVIVYDNNQAIPEACVCVCVCNLMGTGRERKEGGDGQFSLNILIYKPHIHILLIHSTHKWSSWR